MPYDVSSWFYEQTISKQPAPLIRTFTIGSSDYSSGIIKWPTIKSQWDKVSETKHTLALTNNEGDMNFLHQDKTLMNQQCSIKFGYTHPESGDETIDIFTGKITKVKYANSICNITVADKFKQLSERVIGSSDEPIEYTGNDLPSTIAWEAITSYGGFSAITSTSNPDIDYASFSEWASIWSGDAVYMNARFEGIKVTDVLRRISKQTLSAIFVQENKLFFHRYGIINTNVTSIDDSNIKEMTLSFNDTDMINKQYVFAGYDVTSKYFLTTVYDQDTASVNSYGLKEETLEDSKLWYVNSSSAINMAQRIVITKSEPFDRFKIKTTLVGVISQIGDTIQVVDSQIGVASSFRGLNKQFNMDKGIIELSGDRSQFSSGFILDTSSLNGTDVLT